MVMELLDPILQLAPFLCHYVKQVAHINLPYFAYELIINVVFSYFIYKFTNSFDASLFLTYACTCDSRSYYTIQKFFVFSCHILKNINCVKAHGDVRYIYSYSIKCFNFDLAKKKVSALIWKKYYGLLLFLAVWLKLTQS